MNTPTANINDLLDRLRARLGERGVLTDPADTAPYCEDWRRLYRGRTPAVLRPASVAEVAEAVRLCAERGAPIVPQGGNTSMVGGAAVSEAGVTLKAAQDATARDCGGAVRGRLARSGARAVQPAAAARRRGDPGL